MSKNLKSYVLTQDFKAAYVVATGQPNNPQKIMAKQFRKGEIVNGVLQAPKGETPFLLVGSTLVLPINVIKEVVTRDLNVPKGTDTSAMSNADGSTSSAPVKKAAEKISRFGYVDAVLIGGIIGLVVVVVCEKKQFLIKEPNPKNKAYGALGGALLGCYLVWKSKKSAKVTVKTPS